ncbi:MAG TPA: hypothetical protein VGN57_17085 [Pirellulaceae bacterium]|jgi:hypothetical protein|nr:hypothetical protein [Pirellulaceae bacterium]
MAEKFDKFDPYRESLVVEIDTVWPEECRDWSLERKATAETRLHATASRRSQLRYFRLHTGFCRIIIPTADDLREVEDSPQG